MSALPGRVIDDAGRTLFARAEAPRGYFSRLRGLIARPPLDDDQALWFARCRAVHTCGLRHAIDVVHLDAGGRVLLIHPWLGPWRLSLSWRGAQVIELAAGNARRAGLGPGQQLRFQP